MTEIKQNIKEKLLAIQASLKAPKGQMNKFGGYSYRSAEDILTAVKPHLASTGTTLIVSDEVQEVGGRIYVRATATLADVSSTEAIFTTAYAREAEEQKGMNPAQITGSASSYARKYALNGLLCIDDVKDADATNTHGRTIKTTQDIL
jgi:hypothetical protein